MYLKGQRSLQDIEKKLEALRAESRTGYGTDEVRRQAIRAELTHQRETRERALREAQDALFHPSSSPGHSYANAQAGTKVTAHSRGVGDVAQVDNRLPPAPWMQGNFTDGMQEAPTALAEGSTSSSQPIDTIVAKVHSRQVELLPSFYAALDGYQYDYEKEALRHRVIEYDASTGIPSLLSTSRNWTGISSGQPVCRDDGFLSALRATLRSRQRALSVPDIHEVTGPMNKSLPPELDWSSIYHCSNSAGGQRRARPPMLSGVVGATSPASRDSRRSCARYSTRTNASRGGVSSTTSSLIPRAARARSGSRQVLSRQGTAVAVNTAAGLARALQKRVAQHRTDTASVAERSLMSDRSALDDGDDVGMDDTEEEQLVRVVELVTLGFCGACERSFTRRLDSISETQETPDVKNCPHCGAEQPPLDDSLCRMPVAGKEVTDGDVGVVGVLHASASTAPCGEDRPTSADGVGCREDSSFAAALQEVRRDFGLQLNKADATGTTFSRGVGTSAGANEDKPPSMTMPSLSPGFDRALRGLYFLHLWDEVQHRFPAKDRRTGNDV